jgi:hypothetical protein
MQGEQNRDKASQKDSGSLDNHNRHDNISSYIFRIDDKYYNLNDLSELSSEN